MTLRVGIDVHTIGRRQTGNETYVRELVRALEQARPGDVDYTLFQSHAGSMPAFTSRVVQVRPHMPLVRVPWSLPRAMKRERIEVAHFQYVAPPRSPCPIVLTVHDVSFERHPEFFSPLERMRLQTLVPWCARHAAAVIAVSETTRQEILDVYGLDPARVRVIHNGTPSEFRPVSAAVADRAARAVGLTEPYCLAVGNLEPRKNLERVLRIYRELRRTGRMPLRLLLVGQRGRRSGVARAIAQLGLEDDVVVSGFVSDEHLVALYNGARMSLYLSLYEGFGLPILESMACGTPVLTSNRSSMAEIAGEAALLVDPEDDEAIADAWIRLAGDDALCGRFGAAGIERAQAFTWREAAERTLRIYRDAAAERRCP